MHEHAEQVRRIRLFAFSVLFLSPSAPALACDASLPATVPEQKMCEKTSSVIEVIPMDG